ncbi:MULTISPECIES: hypothetical protein [unclassified Streptomyces]|uniref:hypothetical protein n=1 Tax=unclassified Streptomyces TaxID=2593676 RepID=UPI00109E3B65|nr:hypothetical protein [Streptomyces sp. A1136]THA46300.1 hypothetical protein E6R62_34150 [Streptomyces sp. A1136]
MFRTIRDALVHEKWRAIPMTIGAVALTSLFQIVQNTPWGFQPVQDLGSVKAADPLWLALLRTPLSLFVPALDLPVWGALAQILLVFGISEICIGWWRTLVIGYVATLAGTTYARIGLSLGPGHPFGLPVSDRVVNDTGPSAAVVGLAIFVCWRYRAYLTGGIVIAVMIGEVLIKDNLAGKEHLAAIAAVMAVCAARAKWGPERSRTPLGRRPPPEPSPRVRRD